MTAEPPLVQQFNRASGNLSPATISAIIAMADIGRISRFVDLVHEFRQKDGHMHACLQASELAIGSLPWDIDPPPNPNRKERKAAALAKEALLANIHTRNLFEHLAGEGPLFGHAAAEAIWEHNSLGYVPTTFKAISCRRFGFRMLDGALLFDPRGVLEADVNVTGVDLGKEYPLGKFLQYRPRINGDVPAREGLGRFLIWLALGRNWTYKDWLEFAELAWKPKRFGKYLKTASADDKQALIDMLEQVMAGGVGIFPETTDPQFMWAQLASSGKASAHKELEAWIAGEMSKGILGSTDIVEPSENGAKAAVETRNQLRVDIRNARAEGIATQAIQPLVVAITRLNAGDNVRPGTFKFVTVEPPDLSKFAAAVKDLTTAKVRVVESWVHDQVGMPQPQPNDVLVGDSIDENGNRVPPKPQDDDDNEGAGGDDAKKPDDDSESGSESDDKD